MKCLNTIKRRSRLVALRVRHGVLFHCLTYTSSEINGLIGTQESGLGAQKIPFKRPVTGKVCDTSRENFAADPPRRGAVAKRRGFWLAHYQLRGDDRHGSGHHAWR